MRTTLTAVALMITVLAGTGNAHLGKIVYPIYEIPTSDLPDLHDGTLEDWEAVLPNASMDHNYFTRDNNYGPGGIDPGDLAFRVFLAWHSASQRIYMAVERLDDVYMEYGEGSMQHGEGAIQLKIDGDHSGGQFWFFGEEAYSPEERDRLLEAQAQSYSVGLWGDEGRVFPGSIQMAQWPGELPWADAGGFQWGQGPNTLGLEFAVTAWDDLDWHGPETSRRSVLEGGKVIGFQINIDDTDEFMRSSGRYTLSPSTVIISGDWGSHDGFADNFVDGELIPCYRGDCSGVTTAVRQDAWGRIKASFAR